MKQQNPPSIRHIVLFALPVLILGSLFFFYRTHATPLPSPNDILNANQSLLLYSGGADGNFAVQSLKSSSTPQIISDFGNAAYQGGDKELFLSPNRQLIAITIAPIGEFNPTTYIAKIDGTQITPAHLGRFESWAPDSSKALLYVSPMEAPWERRIYALDPQGKYYDSGLPNGTISTDISPVDGSVAYSLTNGGTDNSTLYIRDGQGNDRVLLVRSNSVFAWIRWSPKGDKIAFMKAGLFADSGEVWTMNPDGTGQEKASDIDWNYPAVWSPDGAKLAFSNAGNIWEYDGSSGLRRNASNLSDGGASHPSYSADGKTIVFSSGGQIRSAQNGSSNQLTSGVTGADYPILP